MDRQIPAERAWSIPYKIMCEFGNFDFSRLLSVDLDGYNALFDRLSLHRFNPKTADVFYEGPQRIHAHYEGDASRIWANNPHSATVVRRFLQFKGVGIKISTMATNILVRDFKIPMADRLCIDISPDVQVKRVFARLGIVDADASTDELIYAARELNPEYPGVFDLSVWEIGKKWCRPQRPKCNQCFLNQTCPKIGVQTQHD
jgi:endonuclease III